MNLALFRALRSRNYRLYFSGQLFSVIGTWMQNIALSWYVYHLTDSSFYLGLISFMNLIPTLVLTPFAGVIADRFDKRRILVLTQTLSMVQALLLAFLVLTGHAPLWSIFLLGFMLGVVNALDAPVRQAFVIKLVDRKEDLGNAIALNSALFNSARLIGPTIAGILIAAFGEGMCFLINGISYIAVLSALFAMRIPQDTPVKSETRLLTSLQEGFLYSLRNKTIRTALLLVAFFSVFGFSYTVILPVIAKKTLSGNAGTLGFIMGAAGFGALAGALTLAARKKVQGLWRWVTRSALMTGLVLMFLAFSSHLVPVLIFAALMGFFMILLFSSLNTIIQHTVDDSKRGIVMSFYTLAFMGMQPIGSLLIGTLSHFLDTRMTLLMTASICLLFSLGFLAFFRRRMREVRKKTEEIVPLSEE